MELEVNSDAVAVETVEVVAGGEDGAAAALLGQQLMVATTQDLIVPSPEVGVSGSSPTRSGNNEHVFQAALEAQGLEVTGGVLGLAGLPSSQSGIVTLPVGTPASLSQSVQIGSKRPSAEISL